MKITLNSKELMESIPTINHFNIISKPTIFNNEILVTGGSGFVGIHLLKQLVESKRFNQVHTIVRDISKLKKQAEYFKLNTGFLNEIKVIEGDLLDLNIDSFPNVQYIIHSAAQIHCIKTLKQLWNNNVLTTQKIAEIYQNNDLSFISTLSVFVSSNKIGKHLPITLDENNEYYELYGGYAQSKYIAEKIVERGQGKIIRLGLITGSTKYAIFPNDFFTQIVKLLNKIKTYPMDYQQAYVDLTPVDLACYQIIEALDRKEKIIHIANKNSTPLSDFIEGLHLKAVSNEVWLKKIESYTNLDQILLKYAFFKEEMLKTHFNYFNIDLFQSTHHNYAILNEFEVSNKTLLKNYIKEIIKNES